MSRKACFCKCHEIVRKKNAIFLGMWLILLHSSILQLCVSKRLWRWCQLWPRRKSYEGKAKIWGEIRLMAWASTKEQLASATSPRSGAYPPTKGGKQVRNEIERATQNEIQGKGGAFHPLSEPKTAFQKKFFVYCS